MASSILSPSSCVALLVLSLAQPAFAQGQPESAARERFEAARSAYDQGQLEKALQLYTEAYDLKPLPPFLFNVAQCHRLLGHLDRAGFFYERFLELAPDHPSAGLARELLAEVRLNERRRQEGIAREREVTLVRLSLAKAEAELLLEKQRAQSKSVFGQWWFWTGVGAAAATTTAALATVLIVAAQRPAPASAGGQ